MKNSNKRQYRAFISYSHADKVWGRWVARKLETYRIPRRLQNGDRRLRPVFRDEDDMAANPDLWAEIADNLSRSDALVVVCSPQSAKSTSVDKEIREFKALGRSKMIFGMIIDGAPGNPLNECFPPALKDNGNGPKSGEPLAVDIRAQGRHDALLKLIAGIRGLEFDQLKRRDRLRAIWRGVFVICTVVFVLVAYATSLFVQARAVNQQASGVLAALSKSAMENGEPGRALRFAILSARETPISPVAPEAEPTLISAYYATTLRAEFREHDFSVYHVAFDQHSRRLLSAAQDGTVRFYAKDDNGWRTADSYIDTGEQLAAAHFVGDGAELLSLPLSGSQLTFWQPTESGWNGLEPFDTGSGMIRAFGTSQNGMTVALGYQSQRIELWAYDAGNWRIAHVVQTTLSIPTAAAVTRDGSRVAFGDFDGNVALYEQGGDGAFMLTSRFELMPYEIRRLRFSAEGDRLLALSLGAVNLASFQEEQGWIAGPRIASDPGITDGSFLDAGGRQVLTNARDNTAVLWREIADGNWTVAAEFGSEERHARSIAAAPNGTIFATGGTDNPTVNIWGPAAARDWQSFLRVTQGIGLVENVDLFVDNHTGFDAQPITAANGARIGRGNVYGIVTIQDSATGIELAQIDASRNPQYGIAFSEDGTSLRILDNDGQFTGLDFPVEVAVALSGTELIQRVCSDRLGGALAILDQSDIETAPLLSGRLAEDVCVSPTLWKQIISTIGLLTGLRHSN